MRYVRVLAILSVLAAPAPALAQQVAESAPGLAPADSFNPVQAFEPAPGFRIRLATESADTTGVLLREDDAEAQSVTALTGQLEFHPFGDEFFLSAGARKRFDENQPDWARLHPDERLAHLPGLELSDLDRDNRLESLVRYFGAGMTVRTMDDWSLRVEGGAYFQDTSETRLELLDPETGERVLLLDDLDRVDREAVGDSQARSVRPVGHLVIRRRF